MNHIRWAAWGVVDIEHLPTDMTPGKGNQRQARRNYLRKVHAELAAVGMKLAIGGTATNPWYAIDLEVPTIPVTQPYKTKQIAAGADAFKKICAWVLEQTGDTNHERGADGGVRCAGDEAQV